MSKIPKHTNQLAAESFSLVQSVSERLKQSLSLEKQSEDHSSLGDLKVPVISTDDEDSAGEECVYCSQPYKLDKCGEQWICCITCLYWVHELCASINKKG